MAATINFRNKHPMMLVDRILALQAIREIGPDLILKLEKKFHVFLIEEQQNDESWKTVIDWEFAIFNATEHQYETLIANFVKKEPEAKSVLDTPKPKSLLIPDHSIETEERPPLYIPK